MEDNEGRISEHGMDGLNLIDVSSEDDSLLFSSFLDHADNSFSETVMADRVLGFLGNEHDCSEEIPVSSLQEKEQVLQPHESPEPQKTTKGGKYNLRKSLAWDNAFFTNAGVLEPEELSSIIESNQKGEKQMLSTILEDVHRSTESISTLQSDCTSGDSHKPVLFKDIRASIQKSSKAFLAASPKDTKESGVTETTIIPSSSKTDNRVSHNKMKPKASPKKPSIGVQGLGRAGKQVSLRPPVSQVITAREGLIASVSKPPKGVAPMSTKLPKRASLDVNRMKLEKGAKNIEAGKRALGPQVPVMGRAKNILPKPVRPSKASLGSSAVAKNELTSSCSSLESCASASSSSSHKSSLNLMTNKNDFSSQSDKPSFTARSTSRIASKSISQRRNPHFSTHAMSKSKLHSSTSPASSISEWSSDSSMASTRSERANSSKAHNRTISRANDGISEALNSQNNSSDRSSAGCDSKVTESACEGTKQVSKGNVGIAHPASTRPTGLRMPTPKIGFFDGVRTVTRTPTGNVQRHPCVPRGMPRIGCHSPSGSSSSASSGKVQSARSLPQEFSNSKIKATNVSRSPTIVSVSSQKVQSRKSTKTTGGNQLKVEGDNEMKGSGKNNSPALVKDRTGPGSKGTAAKGMEMIFDNGKPEISVDGKSVSGDESIITSIKLGEEGNTKDKVVDDEIDKLTKQIGALDSNMAIGINNSSHDGDGLLGGSTGSAVIEVVDKTATLPSPENIP